MYKNKYNLSMNELPYQYRRKHFKEVDSAVLYHISESTQQEALDNLLPAINSGEILNQWYFSSEMSYEKKISDTISIFFKQFYSYIQQPILEALFDKFDVKRNLNYQLDTQGNSVLHRFYDTEKIEYFANKYNLNLNTKNAIGNNPFEHHLHKNQYALAEACVNAGSNISRSLKDELVKALEEYLELDNMNDLRYQIIFNILINKNIVSIDEMPPELNTYINNPNNFYNYSAEKYGECRVALKDNYIQDISWIKNKLSNLAEYLISQSESIAPQSLTVSEAFIKQYADASHYLNQIVMQENAALKGFPLAHFSEDITVYRGMMVSNLEQINQWFKYGYESYSCQDYVPARSWIDGSARKYSEISHSPASIVTMCAAECGSFEKAGLNAGVVYTSSNPNVPFLFANGAYSLKSSKISVVQEIKVHKNELHLEPYKYECSINLPSVKSENIVAVYLIGKSKQITKTYVNPVHSNTKLHFIEDLAKEKQKSCPNFDKLEVFSKLGLPAASISEYRDFIAKVGESELIIDGEL